MGQQLKQASKNPAWHTALAGAMRIRAAAGTAQPEHHPSTELEPLKNAILHAKTDEELIAAVGVVEGEDQWEEQPDLYDWCDVLDRLDEALESAIYEDPSLLLIQANQSTGTPTSTATSVPAAPKAGDEAASATAAGGESEGRSKAKLVLRCLQFLGVVMRNCVNKHVFSSTEHLRALLAARDDAVAEAALRCITLLTMPPLLHRHQQPELHSMCSIHNDKTVAAEFMAMSGGWGGRGQGLGLLACVTGRVEGEALREDDAIPSSSPPPPLRPILPAHTGDLHFEYTISTAAPSSEATPPDGGVGGGFSGSRSIHVPITPAMTHSEAGQQQERKREAAAEMFERLSKEYDVPKRRLFSLLARVRAAVAWGDGLEARRGAVRRRIMALTALVYCHPSQEALMAYITLQPELIQELVDLVRVRTEPTASGTVPLDISILAVHCLAALVHTRSGGASLGLVARHTHVFQELGITRGQYTGLLPMLVRHGVADLFTMPEQDVRARDRARMEHGGEGQSGRRRAEGPAEDGGWSETKTSQPGDNKPAAQSPPPDAALSLGMAFVEAAGASPATGRQDSSAAAEPDKREDVAGPSGGTEGLAAATAVAVASEAAATSSATPPASGSSGRSSTQLSEVELDQLRWVETVFSLVWAVVSVQPGAAAMTECGLIPALLNVVQLNMDGQGFGGMEQPFHRRYVVSQAVQIMETAVVNNTTALATFREMDAAEVLASAFSTELGRLRDAGAAAAKEQGVGGSGDGGMVVDSEDAATPEGKGKSKKSKAKGKGKGPDKDGGCGGSSAVGEDGDAASRAPLCPPSASQKALLFSLLNALSISAQNQTPSHQQPGSDPLLEDFLTAAVLNVFRNSDMFGGVLVALTATLISDVANQDPSATVPYLLSSGIVDAYLTVLTTSPPQPSSEFLVTVPQVLHAMCLTHDGAAAVQKRDVFPALFRMLRSPEYMHPQTRSTEGNMTSVVGTGLDELMRHVPMLRSQCIGALVTAMKEMVKKGDVLLRRELDGDSSAETLNERSLVQQYAAHMGQLLESVLARPEQAKPFADAGGDDALLSMFSLAVPGPRPLLARASCAWGHTSQGLANHPAAHALTGAMKALGMHDTGRLLKRVLAELDTQLDKLNAARAAVISAGGIPAAVSEAADVMEVEGQAAAQPAAPSTIKKGKGKGKSKGPSGVGSASSAAPGEDSDVDMGEAAAESTIGADAVAAMFVDGEDEMRASAKGEQGKGKVQELDMVGVLDCIPREPVYMVWPLPSSKADAGDSAAAARLNADGSLPSEISPLMTAYTNLLRCLAVTEWLAVALALLTRWVHSRGAQAGGGQQAVSSWGPILVSGNGRKILERLMRLHRYILMEVSRARADHQAWLRELESTEAATKGSDGEENDHPDKRSNTSPSFWPEPDFYRIHIVAQDVAPVGSGVDSDGAAPVHTLDHGTIVVAYERAANSAGVTRYRTRHGWISENLRGNGRQPVAEVVAVGLAGQGEPAENDVLSDAEKRRREQLPQQPPPRKRPVNGLRAAGSNSLARLHMVIKQLITAFARVLAGSMPRLHHREDMSLTMSPIAPSVCEFLSESLAEGLALGLGKTKVSFGGELSAEARCTHLAGVLETAASALFDERRQVVNTLLLVRMERRGAPFRLLLEACGFIFDSALEMAGGPTALESPTLAFQKGGGGAGGKGGVEESKGGEPKAGTQEAWEAFNRQMDAQDRAVAEKAAAAASGAADGEGGASDRSATRGELPPAMVEVLKVSLSLLRRLASRNLTSIGSPFSSVMPLWHSGHPQRREWENALAMAGEPAPPLEEEPSQSASGSSVQQRSATEAMFAAIVEATVAGTGAAGDSAGADGRASGAAEPGGQAGDRDNNDDDEDPPPPGAGAAAATSGSTTATPNAASSTEVVGENIARPTTGGNVDAAQGARLPSPPLLPSTPAPAAATPVTPGAPSRGATDVSGAGSGASSARANPSKGASGKGKKPPPPPFSFDLFIRNVHILVGETLEPVWRDPRLPALPQEAASRVLAAVLELMQSLQAESSHSGLMRQRQRALTRNQERAALAAAGAGGRSAGGGNAPRVAGQMARWSFLTRPREPAAPPVPFVPDERSVTQLMEMGFTRDHVLMALRATESNRVEVAMEYLLTHPAPPPAPAPSAASTEGAGAGTGGSAATGSASTSDGAAGADATPAAGASSTAAASAGESDAPNAGDSSTPTAPAAAAETASISSDTAGRDGAGSNVTAAGGAQGASSNAESASGNDGGAGASGAASTSATSNAAGRDVGEIPGMAELASLQRLVEGAIGRATRSRDAATNRGPSEPGGAGTSGAASASAADASTSSSDDDFARRLSELASLQRFVERGLAGETGREAGASSRTNATSSAGQGGAASAGYAQSLAAGRDASSSTAADSSAAPAGEPRTGSSAEPSAVAAAGGSTHRRSDDRDLARRTGSSAEGEERASAEDAISRMFDSAFSQAEGVQQEGESVGSGSRASRAGSAAGAGAEEEGARTFRMDDVADAIMEDVLGEDQDLWQRMDAILSEWREETTDAASRRDRSDMTILSAIRRAGLDEPGSGLETATVPLTSAQRRNAAGRLGRALAMDSEGERPLGRTNGVGGSLRLLPSSAAAQNEAKEKAAAEKSYQEQEEADLKTVCSVVKTLVARFQSSVEEACFRLVTEAYAHGTGGGAGVGGGQEGHGRSRRRDRERAGAASDMSFIVAKFLAEQARAHRTSRLSDFTQTLGNATNDTSARASGSADPANSSLSTSSTAPGPRAGSLSPPPAPGSHVGTTGVTAPTTGATAPAPAGAEGAAGAQGASTTGEAGASTAAAENEVVLSPAWRNGRGTSSGRSSSSAGSLDGPTLVASCMRRAEAMLPGGGKSGGPDSLAAPGLAGVLHVLLLLATGVTETQRGVLVTSGFHLKLVELFKTTMATLRNAQRESRAAAQQERGAAAAVEWPDYVAPCLLLLDLLAKPSNVAKSSEVPHEQPQQQEKQQQPQAPGVGGSRGAAADDVRSALHRMPAFPPNSFQSLAWCSAGGNWAGTTESGSAAEAKVEERSDAGQTAVDSGGAQPVARTTETTSSSSTSPTEGGPPARAESKESGSDGGSGRGHGVWAHKEAWSRNDDEKNGSGSGGSTQEGGNVPALAESKKPSDWRGFVGGSPPAPAAPQLHVLLSPAVMLEILDMFIEFFAGVAVPPPSSSPASHAPGGEGETVGTAAARAAAEEAAAAGAALPTPTANLVFASLQLLVRLVRDYGRADRFIVAGGASSLLAIPGTAAFDSSTALLAVVFRHLLEDPSTLQSAMETEIRAAFTRLSRLAGTPGGGAGSSADAIAGGSGGRPPAVRLLTLMSVLRPLLMRDGRVVVKAAANVLRSVEVSNAGGAGSGANGTGDQNGGNVFVTLATGHKHGQQQGVQTGDKQEKLAGAGSISTAATSADTQSTPVAAPSLNLLARTAARQRTAGAAGAGGDRRTGIAGGGAGPSALDRIERDGRSDSTGSAGGVGGSGPCGAPHQNRTTIMSLLLSELVLRHEGVVRRSGNPATGAAAAAGRGSEFLGEANLLELLSDLVLHLPACATSIHRFGQRERSSNAARLLAPTPGDAVAPRPGSAAAVSRAVRVLLSLRHAVTRAEAPNATVVAFLLHVLLPSPRAGDAAAKGITDPEERRKRKAASAVQGRKAQAAARLLLSLCARAGEGRRRVLAELYWALSCQAREGAGAGAIADSSEEDEHARGRRTDTEMWALQAWGELALGLAAPRTAHAAGYDYGNQALAWDVVRAVTDLGAVSALTRALSRVDLNHSRAPACGAALVRPLEMLTRASVAENMRRMKAKDDGRGAALAGALAAAAAATESAGSGSGAGASASPSASAGAAGAAGASGGVSTPNRRSRGRRRDTRTPGTGGSSGGAAGTPAPPVSANTPNTGGSGSGAGAGPRTPGRRSHSRRRAALAAAGTAAGAGASVGAGAGGGSSGDGGNGGSGGPGAGRGAGAVAAVDSPSRARLGSASTPGRNPRSTAAGGASGGASAATTPGAPRGGPLRTRTASQDSRVGTQNFADDDMLDEAFGGHTAGRGDDMLVEMDLSAIVADMEDGEDGDVADGGTRRHRHRSSRLGGGGSYGARQAFDNMDEDLLEMGLDPGPRALGDSTSSDSEGDRCDPPLLDSSSSSSDGEEDGDGNGHDDDDDDDDDQQRRRGGRRGDVMEDIGDDEEEDDEDDDDDDDDDDEDEDEEEGGDEDDEGEEEEDGDEDEDGDDEELDEEDIDLSDIHGTGRVDDVMGDEDGVYVLEGGGDEDMPPELDWGAEDGFTRQDLGAIYAQVGWDAGNMGGAAGAAAAAAVAAAGGGGPGAGGGIPSFVHQFGPGDVGGDGWIRGSPQDQLSVWGVQPPPGLARQYATTRHGERGAGGMNVMTMSDFIESDSALSQMLRSVPPPGVIGAGGSPVVRIVRGAGADGRWTGTQMITHDIHTAAPGPSLNTTRLFPDGPSAATQAHAAPVVHPLLMGQGRTTAGSAGTTRSSGRGSRGSRISTGLSARQHVLDLLPNERLIWAEQAGPAIVEETLMGAIEPFGSAGTGGQIVAARNPADPSGSSGRRGGPHGMATAGGPPMANEGRWTDNGQPLTAADGRIVLPMLTQVEQAVVARLIPSQQATGERGGAATRGGRAGGTAEQPENGEVKEEQEEKESKDEEGTSAAASSERAGAASGAAAPEVGNPQTSTTAEAGARDNVSDLVERAMESAGAGVLTTTEADATAAAAAAAAAAGGAGTAMAVEDTASVSEGEAVAALASSLSLSPRRDPSAEANTAESTPPPSNEPAPSEEAVDAAGAIGNRIGGDAVMESLDGGQALAALLHSADQAAMAAAAETRASAAGGESGAAPPARTSDGDAMDVEEEDGVEETKGGESEETGGEAGGAATRRSEVGGVSDATSDAAVGDRMEEEEEAGGSGNADEGGDTNAEDAAPGEGAAGDGGGAADGAGDGEERVEGSGAASTACPPGMDPDVFAQLPPEMQQEVIREHRSTVGAMEDQAQLLEAAGLDPEALAALPPEMRQEILEQEARNRRMREAPNAAPADPSRAADMDNASFVATLPPELRRDVLLSADETLLNTLPPNLVAEAMVLRERNPHQAEYQAAQAAGFAAGVRTGQGAGSRARASTAAVQAGAGAGAARQAAESKDPHEGEWKMDADLRGSNSSPPQVPRETVVMLIRLLHLLNPIRPHRLLQRTVLNLCASHPVVRRAVIQALVHLVKSDPRRLRLALQTLPSATASQSSGRHAQQQRQPRLKVAEGGKGGGDDGSSGESDSENEDNRRAGAGAGGGSNPDANNADDFGVPDSGEWGALDEFPPRRLLGPASDSTAQPMIAAATRGRGAAGGGGDDMVVHPVVARRGLDFLWYLCKTSSRVTYDMLTAGPAGGDDYGSGGDIDSGGPEGAAMGVGAPVAEAKTPGKGKGKGKGKRGLGKGKSKQAEAMDIAAESTPGGGAAEAKGGATRGLLLEQLVDLLDRPLYTMSGPDLDDLLQLIEVLVSPLSNLKEQKPSKPKGNAADMTAGSAEESKMEVDADGEGAGEAGAAAATPTGGAAAGGGNSARSAPATAASEKYEWVKIPAPVVQHARLRLLCSVLRLEACSDSSFQRVGNVVSNLSKVPENRLTLLKELVSVARSLGSVSTSDLQSLGQQLEVVKSDAVARAAQVSSDEGSSATAGAIKKGKGKAGPGRPPAAGGGSAGGSAGVRPSRSVLPPIVVNLNSSTTELKLLRVLQTLVNLCGKDAEMLENLLRALELDALWEALSSCLSVVSVLEGVADEDDVIDEGALVGDSSGQGAAAGTISGAEGGVGGGGGGRAWSGGTSSRRQGSARAEPAEGGDGAQSAKRTSAMAGLVARFLPVVEAFFVANARDPKGTDKASEDEDPEEEARRTANESARGASQGQQEQPQQSNDGTSSSTAPATSPSTEDNSRAATQAGSAAEAATAASGTDMDVGEAGAAAGAAAATEARPEGESKAEDGSEAGLASGTRLSRRESLQRMTTMPGARFRKNVPRNMRPLIESESEKGATPESQRLSRFVARHKALLNALLHQNPTLLDKSLSAMVHNPRCRQHLDFENKRAFFRSQLRRLRQHSTRRYGSLRLTVPRNQVFEYSFHQLRVRTADEMRGRLHITFQNEDGIDAGGLTREWYSILARDIFNQNYALFIAAADGATFQPNPVSHVNSDHLVYFKFVGRIVGKAIADGQALDAHFTQSFYKHILGVQVTHQDMEAIDPDYYKNLLQITTLPLEDLGLDLTFSADTEMFGRHEVVDLIPNGRNVMVTDDNKLEYVQRITHHRMTRSIRGQIEAFLEGFHELVPPELISIFTPKELELLISGLPDIDLDDLQNNTEYTTYKSTDKEIQWFWNVLRSFSREDLALFLQYVTGTSKVPLGGFATLQGMRGPQKFNIHKAFGGSHLLPAAHTCFNQLDLPKYTSEEMTRERTLVAIHQGSEGFGFG